MAKPWRSPWGLIGKSIFNIGLIYQDKGDYDKALEFYNKSLKISEELGYKSGISKKRICELLFSVGGR